MVVLILALPNDRELWTKASPGSLPCRWFRI